MELADCIRLVRAIRDTAEALRQEAEIAESCSEAAFLRDGAEACERRAAEMERDLPAQALARSAAL